MPLNLVSPPQLLGYHTSGWMARLEGEDMRRPALAMAVCAATLLTVLGTAPLKAADLTWSVESPFRFFKPTRSFAMHEAAFNAVRGDPTSPIPADIIWRT